MVFIYISKKLLFLKTKQINGTYKEVLHITHKPPGSVTERPQNVYFKILIYKKNINFTHGRRNAN